MKNKIVKAIALILIAAVVVTAFAACKGEKAEAKVKLIDISLTDEVYAFGVSKSDADLLKSINEYIAEIKENGKFDEITDKYFGNGTPEGVVSAQADTSKDQLVVATNAEFAPFEYKKGDTFYGIDLEIMNGFAQKLGKEIVILDSDFDSVLSNVEAGYAQIAAAGLTVSEKRMKQVNFSDTYYTASQKLIVPANDTKFDECKSSQEVIDILNSFDKSVSIGFQTGTTGEYFVSGDADWGFDGFPVTAKGFDSGALAVTDMINGNINYVCIDAAPAQYIVDTLN